MAEETTVLITGVAGFWGARVAARLAAQPGYRLIGLDPRPPREQDPRLRYVATDVGNPLMADLLRAEGVQVVCHLALGEGEGSAYEAGVAATKGFLTACAGAGVRKVVLKSSMEVYGAHPDNPGFLTEEHPLRGSRRWAPIRDLVEIEAFCTGLRVSAPGTELTILRFAHIVGPQVDTPMTRFLLRPLAPCLAGFNPRMQVIHEEDVVEALLHVVIRDVPGTFNVAAEGVLPLNRIRGLAGKIPVRRPLPLAYFSSELARAGGARASHLWPLDLAALRYACVGDLSRMRSELGFQPRFSAEEAVRAVAGRQPTRRFRLTSAARSRQEEQPGDLSGPPQVPDPNSPPSKQEASAND